MAAEQMASQAIGSTTAAGFDRPLLLTPGEDLAGWVFRNAGRAILFLIASTCVLAVLFIFLFILKEAVPFLVSGHLAEMFTSTQWYPTHDPPTFGGWAIILGSLYVTLGALAIAVPTGVLAAVFLSDVVPFGMRQVTKPIIELLAAIPSVAYGFFAVLVLSPWLQEHAGLSTGTNALNASIILAVMAIPAIVSISEDALTAVGREIREGAYALGATRAEAITQVVIPAAGSGILAAIILGMMRAVGETMVVWMASGNASQVPTPWWDLSQSVRTMTATIAGEMGETPKDTTHYYALFAIGLTLLVTTFGMNILSEWLLARSRRTPGGRA
jgi:phosphate transport system permease protein